MIKFVTKALTLSGRSLVQTIATSRSSFELSPAINQSRPSCAEVATPTHLFTTWPNTSRQTISSFNVAKGIYSSRALATNDAATLSYVPWELAQEIPFF